MVNFVKCMYPNIPIVMYAENIRIAHMPFTVLKLLCLGQAVASAQPRPHLAASRAASMIYFVNLCRKCKTIFYRAK